MLSDYRKLYIPASCSRRRLSTWNQLMQHDAVSIMSSTGRTKNRNPLGKIDISGIVVNVFAKFTVFTEEDSGHLRCKFHYNI